MNFDNGVLSFIFPGGFWVTEQHRQNKSNNTVRTKFSQLDFQIIDNEIDEIKIYIFRKDRRGKVIPEDWDPVNFMSTVNYGVFKLEFITQYKSNQPFLFKCWIGLIIHFSIQNAK